jgi:hypothetical protein
MPAIRVLARNFGMYRSTDTASISAYTVGMTSSVPRENSHTGAAPRSTRSTTISSGPSLVWMVPTVS